MSKNKKVPDIQLRFDHVRTNIVDGEVKCDVYFRQVTPIEHIEFKFTVLPFEVKNERTT